MREAQRALAALDKFMSGCVALYPELREQGDDRQGRLIDQPPRAIPFPSGKPRGQEAVLAVMEDPENAARRWSIHDMTEELARRGWTPESDNPRGAVRAALNRLAQSEASVLRLKTKDGLMFRYRPTGEAGTFPQIAETTVRVDSGASKGGSR
jgi:hypothetical protein